MTDYPIHTTDTAPDYAKEPFALLQNAFGFVPAAVSPSGLALRRQHEPQ